MSNLYLERFKGKVFLITGGSSGIGKACAIRAAKEGANVVIVDINAEKASNTLKEINEAKGEATFLQYDITDETNVKEMVEKTVEKYGKLDIAINNVGIMGEPKPLHLCTKEDMDTIMNTNFYSVVSSCKYELCQFIKQQTGGVIINNASVAGLTGIPSLPGYNATKHAVNGLTKNLAIDYAPYGIRVNSVNPASTTTPLTDAATKIAMEQREQAKEHAGETKSAEFASYKTATLQMRMASAEEQAASILFLASDDASHMTGEIITTDGGYTAF